MIETWVTILNPIAIFLLNATVKTTLFMCLVLFAVWLLGTRQAAKRSLLLSWCLIGVLMIPFASLCLPSLRFQFYSSSPDLAVPPLQPVVVRDTPLTQSPASQQRETDLPFSKNTEQPQDFASPPPAQIVFGKNAETQSGNWTADLKNKIAWAHVLYGLTALYAIGVLVLSIRIIYCLIMVCLFRRSLLPCEDQQLQNDLQRLKKQLRIRRSVALSISDKIGSPTQIGLLNPVVVLPTHIVTSREQLQPILIHELIHIKRWDCLYRLLAMIGMAFYWFNPLFHRVKHLLFEVQEQACDDWTVTTTGNSESYANTLLHVATQLQPRPALALCLDMARTAHVMARVNRIITLGGHVTPRVGRASALVLAGALIGGATAIGSLTTAKVDHKDQNVVFEGGVVTTDTYDVQRDLPMKMRDGRLWWRGDQGLYLQDGDAWQKFTLPEGGSLDYITGFIQARNGSVWFTGTYKSRPVIANFNGKTWRIWDSKTTGLGKITVGDDFAEDGKGGIWMTQQGSANIRARGGYDRVKGGNGVLHFDGKAWHNHTVKDGLIHNRVYDIEADPKGGVWIATLRGLSHYKDGKWTSHIVDSVPVEGVRNGNRYDGRKTYKLFYDREGTLWTAHGSYRGRTIRSHRGGISSFDGTAWTHHNAHAGLPINASRYIWQTENGDLWFGTHRDDQTVVESRGLMRYKDGMWLRLTRKHGIPGDFVSGLVEKGDGSFYLRVSGMIPAGTRTLSTPSASTRSYRPRTDHLTTISGKVIDQRGNQPVANMGIWVEHSDGEVHAGTLTDEHGRYRVEVIPGVYHVRLASKNAATPVPVDAKPEGKIEDVDLLLHNSRRISGLVRDRSDHPIANAVVVISDRTSGDARLSPQVVTTDANGMFEAWQIAGLQPTFDVAAEGYAPYHAKNLSILSLWLDAIEQKTGERPQSIENLDQVPNVQIKIYLDKGITLRGRVIDILDDLDKPLAWARVGLGPSRNPLNVYTLPSIPFQRNTYTDEKGLFTLHDVADRRAHIWVNHPETGIMSQEVMPADSVLNIYVERLRLYSVSGVVSLTDVPVERLTIRTSAQRRSVGSAESRIKSSRTDANGAYRIEGLGPGKYGIFVGLRERIKRNDRMTTWHRMIQSRTFEIKDRDITLNFAPLGNARITGVATYNGQPISDVEINTRILDDSKRLIVTSTQSDQEGRFEIHDLPSARIAIKFRKIAGSAFDANIWSKTDTLDLTGKKELHYLADLDISEARDFFWRF